MIPRFALAVVVLLAAACVTGRMDQRRRHEVEALGPAAPSHRVVLPTGETLEVEFGVAILRGPGGVTLAKNTRIVRDPDPGGLCPADGFRSVRVAGEGFEVRNQLCSGWFFIDEIMTFVPTRDGYRLTRISAEYLDRRTNEPDGPPRVLTEAEFGVRRFVDLDPDELYRLFE